MTCGLDTGATSSIMSFKTALRHQITILPSPLRYRGPDGLEQAVTGKTKKLTVNIQGSCVEITFIIIDHSDHDILLGLDWFQATDVGFYPGKKILKFPKLPKYMILDKEEEESNESVIDLCLADIPDELDLDNDISWEPNHLIDIKPTMVLDSSQMTVKESPEVKNCF